MSSDLCHASGKGNSPSAAPPLSLPSSPPSGLSVEHVATLHGHTGRVWCVAWSPLSNTLASCSSDGTVKLWGCISTRQTSTCTEETASQDNEVHDRPTNANESAPCASANWACLNTLQGEHARTVRHVSWSPSANYLACASFDHTVSIWRRTGLGSHTNSSDARTTLIHSDFDYEVEGILDGHESEVKCVSWLTDAMLVTSARDRNVWIWERVDDGEYECAGLLSGHTQDVKYCGWVPTRRCTTGGGVGQQQQHAWTPARSRVFSCSYDNTIKIWADALRQDDWHCEQTLTHHSATVWAAAFQRLEEEKDNCDEVVGQQRHTSRSNSIHTSSSGDQHKDDDSNNNSNDEDGSGDERSTQLPGQVIDTNRLGQRRHHGRSSNNVEKTQPQPLLCTCSDDLTVAFWALNESDKFVCLASCSGFCERSIYSVDWAVGSAPVVGCASGDNSIALLGLYQDSTFSREVHVEVLVRIPNAHESDVNSIAFSHTGTLTAPTCVNQEDNSRGAACTGDFAGVASTLFATGGDDHMVHVWRARL